MWGHEKMNLLSILPVFLLGIVTIWFVWPMVADPILRRRAMRATTREPMADDLFRSIAKHAGPKHELYRASRG